MAMPPIIRTSPWTVRVYSNGRGSLKTLPTYWTDRGVVALLTNNRHWLRWDDADGIPSIDAAKPIPEVIPTGVAA